MTTLRTDLIPDLYANPISTISQANPAVVTVPVSSTIISATGTIGTVAGSGTANDPWTAEITAMTTSAGLVTGNVVTATAGTGTFAAGGTVSVTRVSGNKSITIKKIGGTVPTAGTVTDITLPGVSTLPTFLANANVVSTTGTIGTIPTSGLTSGVTTFTTIAGTSVTAAATYTAVPQASTSGSGVGAVFTVVKAGAGTAYSGAVTITTTTVGSGYAIGDTITVSGANLGGTSPTNDMTLTVGAGSLGGPWTFNVTGMSSVVGLQVGDAITATAGTGTFAANGTVVVASITGTTSITATKTGGTIPTAGSVTNISIPRGTIVLFTEPGNRFTFSSSTGEFQAGENFTQATSGATGLITNVFPTAVEYTVTSGVVNTSNVVTGDTSGATTTPTAVTGMNQLLTAGILSSATGERGNAFYISVLSANTFSLYRDIALTQAVNSTSFTAATPNAGQYTDFNVVVITEA
jgi:hypothetical protein